MAAPVYVPPGMPYLEPYCPHTRNPSNHTHFGFHPSDDLMLGDPDLPRSYTGYGGRNSAAFVDNHQYTSWTRGDLTVRYTYESVMEYKVGDEFISYPIIQTVHRRDFELQWQELIDFHTTGAIPARYPPKYFNGTINEPMNQDAFRMIARRFVLHEGLLHEIGSGLLAQDYHAHFEVFTDLMLPHMCSIRRLARLSPRRLAKLASAWSTIWFIDAIPRATFMLRRWSMMGYHQGTAAHYTFIY